MTGLMTANAAGKDEERYSVSRVRAGAVLRAYKLNCLGQRYPYFEPVS
jgi:hypothetical protein